MKQADAIKQLEVTRGALDAARAELQRIGSIVKSEAGEQSRRAADEAVSQINVELQDMLAAQALGEADVEAVTAVRKRLERAERDLEQARSSNRSRLQLQAGAERRLNEAHAAVSAADEAYKKAQANYVLAELISADERYVKAATELMQLAGRVWTCSAYLKQHARSLLPAACASQLTMPALPTIGPASAIAVQMRTNGKDHGIGQQLTNPRFISLDTIGLESEIEFSLYGRSIAT
jgi:chromosome segregation ATPase